MTIRDVLQRPSYLSATLSPQSLPPHSGARLSRRCRFDRGIGCRSRRRCVDGGNFRKGDGIDDNGAFSP